MLLPSYTIYGLVYTYQALVRPVPLRGVSVDASIIDFVSRTAVSQHFHNTEAFPIEAVYVFPLDERAAVCGFEIEIDGYVLCAVWLCAWLMMRCRVITKGVVQEKQQARATYEHAVSHGDGAQLLEQKRTDIFELVRGCCVMCVPLLTVCRAWATCFRASTPS